MKLKDELHEVLSSLSLQDGVTPPIICDKAKEIIKSEFKRKLGEVPCHFQKAEFFVIWSMQQIEKSKNWGKIRMIALNLNHISRYHTWCIEVPK